MSKERKYRENLKKLQERAERLEALMNLSNTIRNQERRIPISFNDFLYLASKDPFHVFRDIFQFFYDMVLFYIPEGKDEYEMTSDSIGFVDYDFTDLFINECSNPFFADRLFANRFMNLTKGFRKGIQTNRIYLFEGPPGSGKSTFLNNLLLKLESYSKTPQGSMYKTFWRLDVKKLGGLKQLEKENLLPEISNNEPVRNDSSDGHSDQNTKKGFIDISCPNNDHPILQIPVYYREKFLDELIVDKKFREKIFHSKEYEWVLKDSPCSICSSISNILLDMVGNPMEMFNMLNAKPVEFNRQFGKGISIFNPGDCLINHSFTNNTIQKWINELLKTDEIKYIYSYLAPTNNGIFAIMDIKENNIDRLKNLHGVISDGIHKVELVEEKIKSLFMGLVNPEDKVHFEGIKSFEDRIITVNVPYILDYNTEVSIYRNKYGDEINELFLPRVLQNFAKIIISTRMETDSPTLNRWIGSGRYSKHLDRDQLLLKMDIYTGKIPSYLSEEDMKTFDRQTRKDIIDESEIEGKKGISGRQSLNVFNSFMNKNSKPDKLITMNMVRDFFTENRKLLREIPEGFIDSLINLYDFNILEEVKEAIYYYNEQQISKDILNYMYCINFEKEEKVKSEFTGEIIELSEEYFKNFEAVFLGSTSSDSQRLTFRNDVLNEYITKTLSQDIRIKKKNIKETDQYNNLFEKYIRNLKENSLAPYLDNDNFRRGIIDCDTPGFNSYDERLKRDVKFLISNLITKFKYSRKGAKQICLYVLDHNLARKF